MRIQTALRALAGTALALSLAFTLSPYGWPGPLPGSLFFGWRFGVRTVPVRSPSVRLSLCLSVCPSVFCRPWTPAHVLHYSIFPI